MQTSETNPSVSNETNPKLFISYSWTNPDHENWVLQLATELCESGIDVILDKWNLREGHDAHVFMEKMVNDPEIKKVLLICDKAYADKTDGRSGGVGTEAQIISSEIYAKQQQDKFVAIVREHDDSGKAYLPAYYRSRIYIDLSDPATYVENFERLVRWTYGRPLHNKPELGRKPEFLSSDERTVHLPTAARFKRAVDALRNSRPYAVPAAVEYFDALTEELQKIRINRKSDAFDDDVIRSIESFVPYRDEALEVFTNLALYNDTTEARRALHRFFEECIPLLDRPSGTTSWSRWDFDNFKFLIHELFLYAIACLLRHGRFEFARHLMETEYYVQEHSENGGQAMVSYTAMHAHLESLEHRNKRLNLLRLSIRADLLKERCKGTGITFHHLMQADLVLYLRSCVEQISTWWPETLLYADRHSGPFEIFARSRSKAFFEHLKWLLGVTGKDQLEKLIEELWTARSRLPQWGHETFSLRGATGIKEIATKP